MKKLGRVLNHNTLMWEFQDKSGVPIPDEKMREIDYYAKLSSDGVPGAAILALIIKWAYEEKYRLLAN